MTEPRTTVRPRSRPAAGRSEIARRGPVTRRTTPAPDARKRILIVFAVFIVIGGSLVGLLIDLQTLRPDRYRDLGEDQRTRTRELAGFRGSLLDRSGFVLAASTPGRELVADPTMVADPAAAAAALSPVLGIEPAELARRLTPDNPNDRYEMLLRTSDDAEIARVGDLIEADGALGDDRALGGVFFRVEEARVYPAGLLARPVVGQVDGWEEGVFGLEAQFNGVMQGSPGRETSERGIFGSIAGGLWEVEPAEKGYDLVLTIDYRIQFVTEQALIEHCQETQAKSAQAVISDPRTGDLLAMASVVRRDDGTCVVPNSNLPLTESFEPGSVLKVLTAAAAIEELGMTGDSLVPVPGEIVIGDYGFKEHPGHIAADYPLSDVIARSMNVGTIQVAQSLGNQTLYDYYRAFGFGQYTGLDWEYEIRGRVPEPESWMGSAPGSIAIGQGVTANTVQIMSAYNILANDGMYVAPRLIRAAVGPDGVEHDVVEQEARRVVSAATADAVTELLVGVVEHGTGTEAAVEGYRVAGKTGTAWKVFEDANGDLTYGSNGDRHYVLSFAGYLPADDPQISMVVTVDDPDVQGNAGSVAAPVFSGIAQYALRILDVPPAAGAADHTELVRGTPAPDPSIPPYDPAATAETALAPSSDGAGSEDAE